MTDEAISRATNTSKSFCFVEGTPVLTALGLVAIEKISAGDIVIATDTETGETAEKEVVEVYVNESSELVRLIINGEEITTTPAHPFYVPQKGWTSAIDLRAGDMLVLVNGEYVTVEAVQHEILESPVTVYNFQVDDFHTYYVGEQSVLVHNQNNKNGCGMSDDAGNIPGDANYSGEDVSGSWRLVQDGEGAHLIEKSNVRNRSDLGIYDQSDTPRYYPYGTPENAGQAHLRLHEATRNQGISIRGGNPSMSTDQLLEGYSAAYSSDSVSGIRGDLRTPDSSTILAKDVTPKEAYDVLLNWGQNKSNS